MSTRQTLHPSASHAAVQTKQFRRDGYLVLPHVLTAKEIAELRGESVCICRGDAGEVSGVEAPPPGATDEEVLRRYLCIHFPHKVSAVVGRYLAHPSIVSALTAIIGPNVKCMQSMLFIKSAGKPGQAWHQDEFSIPTRDRSLTGAWIAMDDATVENGCLWVLPGSHTSGVIWPQHWHGDRRFDCAGEAFSFPYADEDSVPVEVEAGSVVFFNGYLLHRSLPNRAALGFRRALVNHYMSAESLLPWGPRDEGDKTSLAQWNFRDVVVVAGEDPYIYQGLVDRSSAKVRPSGEGGCESWGEARLYRDDPPHEDGVTGRGAAR